MGTSLRARLTAGALIVLAAVPSVGCGGHDTSDHGQASASAGGDTRAAEATFARDMIVHHRQAVEMGLMAESRSTNPKVKDLAARIRRAQEPEVELMSGWLRDWGKAVPSPSAGGDLADHGGDQGGDHGGGHGDGMMTEQQLRELAVASGAEFDRLFCELMIAHHRGAITMGEAIKARRPSAPVATLADSIITAQRAEIAEMEEILKSV